MNRKIPIFFGLVNLEEEILSSNNFIVGFVRKGLLVQFIFEVLKSKFSFDD